MRPSYRCKRIAYLAVVQSHLKLFEEHPPLGLLSIQVMVDIAGGEAERVKFAIWVQQERGRSLLVHDARVSA